MCMMHRFSQLITGDGSLSVRKQKYSSICLQGVNSFSETHMWDAKDQALPVHKPSGR